MTPRCSLSNDDYQHYLRRNVLGLTRVKGVIVVGKLDQLIPTMGKRHAITQMHIPAR